jgi:hypothetical protein
MDPDLLCPGCGIDPGPSDTCPLCGLDLGAGVAWLPDNPWDHPGEAAAPRRNPFIVRGTVTAEPLISEHSPVPIGSILGLVGVVCLLSVLWQDPMLLWRIGGGWLMLFIAMAWLVGKVPGGRALAGGTSLLAFGVVRGVSRGRRGSTRIRARVTDEAGLLRSVVLIGRDHEAFGWGDDIVVAGIPIGSRSVRAIVVRNTTLGNLRLAQGFRRVLFWSVALAVLAGMG